MPAVYKTYRNTRGERIVTMNVVPVYASGLHDQAYHKIKASHLRSGRIRGVYCDTIWTIEVPTIERGRFNNVGVFTDVVIGDDPKFDFAIVADEAAFNPLTAVMFEG